MRRQHAKIKAKQAKQNRIMCAIAAILGGVLGVIVLKDATALVGALLFVPALFFGRHIYW